MFNLQYQVITHWLHIHPHWGWIVAFIISFAESVAVIGLIVPGSIAMTAIGILVGSGVLPIWSVIISAISGAIIGDSLSYFFGYYFKDTIRRIWPFTRYPQILMKGELFFIKHGGKSVFLGRFVGPVRAIIPIVAGTLRFQIKRYFTASILSAIFWAPTYMLPGILLGALSLELPTRVAAEVILIVLGILLGFWILAWLSKQIYRKTRKYFNQIFDAKWERWSQEPSKRWFCSALRNGEYPHNHGQILIFLVVILLAFLFLFTWINVIFQWPLTHWNNLVYHWFRGVRTPIVNDIAIFVTSLGNKEVLVPVFATILVWLLCIKKWRAAFHWLLVISISGGAAYVVKLIYFSARPDGIIANSLTSSFPSGHVIFSIAVYGFIAFLFAHKRPKEIRKFIYWTVFILCLAIAISRLYLGAHWLTDIMGAITLSLAALYFTIISYRRAKTSTIPAMGIIIITMVTLIVADGIYLKDHFKEDLKNSQPSWKIENLAEYRWWNQTSNIIPSYRTNRLNHPIQVLNIQWAGDLDQIQDTLLAHGWKNINTQHYLETLKKLAQENRKIPHALFIELYRDQRPVIKMLQYPTKDSTALMLRIWPANINLTPGNKPLWVGTIYFNSTHKTLIPFFHLQSKTDPNQKIIDFLTPSVNNQQWKTKLVKLKKLPKKLKKLYPNAEAILIKPKEK